MLSIENLIYNIFLIYIKFFIIFWKSENLWIIVLYIGDEDGRRKSVFDNFICELEFLIIIN